MRVHGLRVRDLTPVELTAWRDLAGRADPPNPMAEPDCVVPAARHLRNGPDLRLIVVEENGVFLAAMPTQPLRRWHLLPGPLYSTRTRRMTWDATPLVDPARADDAVHALLEAMSGDDKQFRGHTLVLEWLNGDGKLPLLLKEAAERLGLPVTTFDEWERPLLIRRNEPTYADIHSNKHLSDRRRMLRYLSRELGGEPKVIDRGDDPQCVDRFIALESSGYKAASGVAMATQPGEIDWFRQMCANFAEQGRLHALSLEFEDTVVAMVLFLRSGDGLYLIKVSYDERFHRFSPGIQLHLATLGWFHDQTDAQWLDVCTYKGNTTMLRQYPDRRPMSTLVIGLGRRTDPLIQRLVGLDPLWRKVAYKLGGTLKVNDATTTLLVEGGRYGTLRPKSAPR